MSVSGAGAHADRAEPCGEARRPGRPRDPAADEAIITAIIDVLAEQGFSGFTVEAVATRAGVGKATIYRRWSTKEDLVLDVAGRLMTHDAAPDTGSLRDDLVTWYWEKFRNKGSSPGDRLMGQMVVEATVNPDLKRLLARFIAARRVALTEVLERAASRGETVGEVDAALLLDIVSGALLHRSLFGDKKLRRIDVERVVDTTLHGIASGSEPARIADR